MMKQEKDRFGGVLFTAMAGSLAAVLLLAVRGIMLPLMRDQATGRFAVSWGAVILAAVVLVVLAIAARSAGKGRLRLAGNTRMPVAVAMIIAGLGMGGSCLWDAYSWLTSGKMPEPQAAEMTNISQWALTLGLVFGVLGGVSLILLGLDTAGNKTTKGIGWWSLAPVLWMWFRLARYEMSYASAANLTESFFDFALFLLEMFFLFKLARWVANVGDTGAGRLFFYAMGVAVLGLSGPLTRIVMFAVGDSEAYGASGLTGIADFGVGLLGLVLGWSLTVSAAKGDEEPEEIPEAVAEEVPAAKAPAEDLSAKAPEEIPEAPVEEEPSV